MPPSLSPPSSLYGTWAPPHGPLLSLARHAPTRAHRPATAAARLAQRRARLLAYSPPHLFPFPASGAPETVAPLSSSPPISLPIEAAPLMALMAVDDHYSLSRRSLSLFSLYKSSTPSPWTLSPGRRARPRLSSLLVVVRRHQPTLSRRLRRSSPPERLYPPSLLSTGARSST
jgi:hypothetical protein